MTNDVIIMQRQMRDTLRNIDDNSMNIKDVQADIRELFIENKCILQYLEERSKDK